jgi:inorganic pyrophosphatase
MTKKGQSTAWVANPTSLVNLAHLQPHNGKADAWNVVVETPKGSRGKFSYDPILGIFRLGKILPLGAVFPFDFGFIPSTIAEDGDPLDILILTDAPAFPGCLASVRLIGVIEAQQREENGKCRNDRVIGVSTDSHNHRNVRSLRDLDDSVTEEIEHFFASYHALGKKPFKAIGHHGPKRAKRLVEQAVDLFYEKLRATA